MMALSNMNKPAPKWFRITKRITNYTINFVIGIMLILGYQNDSLTLLIIKLSQSFIMEVLDTFMTNGEVYAKPETISLEVTKVDTINQ